MYLLNLSKQKDIRAQMSRASAEYKGKVTKIAPRASGKKRSTKVESLDVSALPKLLRDKFFK